MKRFMIGMAAAVAVLAVAGTARAQHHGGHHGGHYYTGHGHGAYLGHAPSPRLAVHIDAVAPAPVLGGGAVYYSAPVYVPQPAYHAVPVYRSHGHYSYGYSSHHGRGHHHGH